MSQYIDAYHGLCARSLSFQSSGNCAFRSICSTSLMGRITGHPTLESKSQGFAGKSTGRMRPATWTIGCPSPGQHGCGCSDCWNASRSIRAVEVLTWEPLVRSSNAWSPRHPYTRLILTLKLRPVDFLTPGTVGLIRFLRLSDLSGESSSFCTVRQ